MTNPVIKVENLSKSYLIGHQSQERYTALRDVLSNAAKGFVKNAADLIRGKQLMGNDTVEEFYALKDINFEIQQGDRVGIIGRNGAGKSTLLKILSRITEPTTGKITLNGRVASLLEVGTGFHPELTGRENIYLNGAILGMSRNDIKRKFDEIVAFAEVEKFLDTPVKRYSSGMYVRLAFAVAAHLEPEILIVDEVLAVGDAEFQKKCLGKMEDVSKNEGRTVLFVSHNMAMVKKLCTKGIILSNGIVKFQGTSTDSIIEYSKLEFSSINSSNIFQRDIAKLKKQIYVNRLELINEENNQNFRIQLSIEIYSSIKCKIGINITLKDQSGFPIGFGCSSTTLPELFTLIHGINKLSIITQDLNLAIGKYNIGLELVIPGSEYLDVLDGIIEFECSNEKPFNYLHGIDQGWGKGALELKIHNI
jgi:lipopolysaccharide transport system ATP-binding protein